MSEICKRVRLFRSSFHELLAKFKIRSSCTGFLGRLSLPTVVWTLSRKCFGFTWDLLMFLAVGNTCLLFIACTSQFLNNFLSLNVNMTCVSWCNYLVWLQFQWGFVLNFTSTRSQSLWLVCIMLLSFHCLFEDFASIFRSEMRRCTHAFVSMISKEKGPLKNDIQSTTRKIFMCFSSIHFSFLGIFSDAVLCQEKFWSRYVFSLKFNAYPHFGHYIVWHCLTTSLTLIVK